VGQLSWSIGLAGTVNADAEAVVAWWFHPDRRTEYLDLAKSRGALDLTYTRSREGGVAVGNLRYRTAQGWEFDHRLESNVDGNGLPGYAGDRYVAESRDLETARSGNQHFSVRCVATHELVAVGPQETRITATHSHTMTGGRWLWRWNRRRKDYTTHNRFFSNKVDQCKIALGRTGTTPTAR